MASKKRKRKSKPYRKPARRGTLTVDVLGGDHETVEYLREMLSWIRTDIARLTEIARMHPAFDAANKENEYLRSLLAQIVAAADSDAGAVALADSVAAARRFLYPATHDVLGGEVLDNGVALTSMEHPHADDKPQE